jgi:hypothetical protein
MGLVVQILSYLTNLTNLVCDEYRMTFAGLSAVSDKLISLNCENGFNISLLDNPSDLKLPRLENVEIYSEDAYDLKFILKVLINSFPSSGRGSLNNLSLIRFPSASTADDIQLGVELTSVLKV